MTKKTFQNISGYLQECTRKKHRTSQLRKVVANLSFNLDEGFVIVGVTIAIVNPRVTA